MAQPALHDILCGVLGESFENCYFSPPANMQMQYPCVIYNYTNDQNIFADNIKYRTVKRYTVTIVDEDPDSILPDKLKELPYCTPDRNFVVDGLNHYVFTLFYNGPRIKEDD